MKTFIIILILISLAACGSPKIDQSTPQPAINPTPNPTPNPTQDPSLITTPSDNTTISSIPVPASNLDTILLGPHDLSAAFKPDSFRSSLPEELSDLPAGNEVASLDLLSVFYVSNITVILYETDTETNEAYSKAIDLIKTNYKDTKGGFEYTAETTADVGDQATWISLDSQTVEDISLIYSKCTALVYIHLFSDAASKPAALRFGKNVQERLAPLACP